MRLVVLAVLFQASLAAAQDVTQYEHYEAVYAASTRPIEAFTAIVIDRPDDPWARHFHARSFVDGRDLHAAREATRRAIALDPEQAFHHRLLGDIEALDGEHAAAAAAYRAAAAVEDRPQPKEFLRGLAEENERLVTTTGSATSKMLTVLMIASVLAVGVFAVLLRLRVRS